MSKPYWRHADGHARGYIWHPSPCQWHRHGDVDICCQCGRRDERLFTDEQRREEWARDNDGQDLRNIVGWGRIDKYARRIEALAARKAEGS